MMPLPKIGAMGGLVDCPEKWQDGDATAYPSDKEGTPRTCSVPDDSDTGSSSGGDYQTDPFDPACVKPPPGLELDGPMRIAPMAVCAPPPGLEEAQKSSEQVAMDKAVTAILAAKEEMDKSCRTEGLSDVLDELVRKTVDAIQDAQDGPCGDAPPGLEFHAKRTSLRSALRSNAKPFVSQGSHSEGMLPKPVLSLESKLPLSFSTVTKVDALHSQLNQLWNESPGRVLVVRQIHGLGHDSPKKLKMYFEWYGPVDRVFLAPSYTCKASMKGGSRVLPSNFGYVVMKKDKHAQEALMEAHCVEGICIEVEPFLTCYNNEFS